MTFERYVSGDIWDKIEHMCTKGSHARARARVGPLLVSFCDRPASSVSILPLASASAPPPPPRTHARPALKEPPLVLLIVHGDLDMRVVRQHAGAERRARHDALQPRVPVVLLLRRTVVVLARPRRRVDPARARAATRVRAVEPAPAEQAGALPAALEQVRERAARGGLDEQHPPDRGPRLARQQAEDGLGAADPAVERRDRRRAVRARARPAAAHGRPPATAPRRRRVFLLLPRLFLALVALLVATAVRLALVLVRLFDVVAVLDRAEHAVDLLALLLVAGRERAVERRAAHARGEERRGGLHRRRRHVVRLGAGVRRARVAHADGDAGGGAHEERAHVRRGREGLGGRARAREDLHGRVHVLRALGAREARGEEHGERRGGAGDADGGGEEAPREARGGRARGVGRARVRVARGGGPDGGLCVGGLGHGAGVKGAAGDGRGVGDGRAAGVVVVVVVVRRWVLQRGRGRRGGLARGERGHVGGEEGLAAVGGAVAVHAEAAVRRRRRRGRERGGGMAPGLWLLGEFGVGVDKGAEAGVRLWVGDLPGEAAEDHADEDDGDAPDVRLAGIVALLGENLGGEVRVRADDAGGLLLGLARIVEDGGGAKVDELDDVVGRHDAVVELEIAVGEPHLVQVLYAVTDLAEDAIDLGAAHLAGHDDTEEVVRRVLHHLCTSDERVARTSARRAPLPRNNGRGRTRCRRSR